MPVVSSTNQLSECVLVRRKIKVFVYAATFCNVVKFSIEVTKIERKDRRNEMTLTF